MGEKIGFKDTQGKDIRLGDIIRNAEGDVYTVHKGVDGTYLKDVKSKDKIWISEIGFVWDMLHFEIIDLEVVK